MVNVDIDPNLYDDIKEVVKKNRLEFPSVKYTVQRFLINQINRYKKENDKKSI